MKTLNEKYNFRVQIPTFDAKESKVNNDKVTKKKQLTTKETSETRLVTKVIKFKLGLKYV